MNKYISIYIYIYTAITYHPIRQALNDVIYRNLNWLYADNEVKNFFHLDPWFHPDVLGN